MGFTQPLTEISTRSRKIMFLASRALPGEEWPFMEDFKIDKVYGEEKEHKICDFKLSKNNCGRHK
jgi:hypothetical protein